MSAAVALRLVTGASLACVYPVGMRMVAAWAKADLGLLIGILVGALCLGSAAPHLAHALGTQPAARPGPTRSRSTSMPNSAPTIIDISRVGATTLTGFYRQDFAGNDYQGFGVTHDLGSGLAIAAGYAKKDTGKANVNIGATMSF